MTDLLKAMQEMMETQIGSLPFKIEAKIGLKIKKIKKRCTTGERR
jgi:hypothetical protein